MLSDLSQGSDEVILDQFNYAQHKHVPITSVKLENLVEIHKSAQIDIRPIKPCDMNGTTKFNFHRINMTEELNTVTFKLKFKESYETVIDILDDLKYIYGLELKTKEIHNDMVFEEEPFDIVFTDRCLLYTGKIRVLLFKSLDGRITKTELNGFEVPENV